MPKFAICNETFQEMKWSDACYLAADAGYTGIEVAPFTLAVDIHSISPQARQVLAGTAQHAGLEVIGLHWLLVSPPGLSLTTPDDSIRARTAEYLSALADFCADLGGHILVLGSPKQRRIPPDETAACAQDRLIRTIEPALAHCELRGITLCLEPLPAPEADLILTLQEAVAVIERMQHPCLKTILDIKSASSEAAAIPVLTARYAPYIAHVHANDANRRGPGFGDTDYVPIFAALDAIGYEGYVSVEVFDYTPDSETIARESLSYMQRCVQEAGLMPR